MECPICYDAIAEGAGTTTSCGHVYHATCISLWLKRGTTCPSCRTPLVEAPTEAPANPEAEPVWFEERLRVMGERLAAARDGLQAIAVGLEAVRVDILEAEAAFAAQKAKRSAAAKRGGDRGDYLIFSVMP